MIIQRGKCIYSEGKAKLLWTQKLIHFVVLSRLCLVVISLKEPNQTFYCINYVVQKAL